MICFATLYCNGKSCKRDTIITVDHSRTLCLQWNYDTTAYRDIKQQSFRVSVFDENRQTVHDSGMIASDAMRYEFPDSVLRPGSIYHWNVTAALTSGTVTSDTMAFETAIDDLSLADWIICGTENEPSAPIFRRCFSVDRDVTHARLYVTGLGLVDCRLNGKPLTDAFLTPPNTRYDKQVYFETLDLTEYLQHSENILTVQLGNGYNMDYSQWGYRYDAPKGLRAAIVLTGRDGTTVRINSDDTWQWQDSPITANGLYLGEEYDAKRTFAAWTPAVISNDTAPQGRLLCNEMPPIRVIERISPVAVWENTEGTVYDFGKNIQGICEISVKASAGCQITLQHSEMITQDGYADLFTNRAARAADIYTCAGTETEHYTPRFTYHGFRYVTVKCSEPTEQFSITALFLSADVDPAAEFACSEPIINRIYALCTNSIRANLVSIPTDCPVRDERTPCLMDSQMYEDAALYQFNMYAYYKKWLGDITAVPEQILGGNMDWFGDSLMLSYRIYRFWGDLNPAKELYPHFKRGVMHWMEQSEDGVWPWGYGDWCLPNDNTWEGFGQCKAAVNTSLLHAYTHIMAEYAELLGYHEDQPMFLSFADRVKQGFIKRYWHEDGTVGNGRQPEMFMPLFYGILTGEHAEKTRTALCKKIRADGYFDVGGFGGRTVIPVLADADALDLYLETVRHNTYPGFGFLNVMGATSLWEQWAVKGSMHSHSHAMHSGISAALYQTLCGVVPTSPAFRTFTIAPCLPQDMRFVRCSLDTCSGRIEVMYESFGDSCTLSCTVPPNTEATLTFPDFAEFEDCLLFDGERLVEKQKTLHIGSGNYVFRLVPKHLIDTAMKQR
ncbi:MAG: family 78 glycoside hydrolase catalytic domain [Clostridia bacterium]|nr:family 78 glycoside hydrolase catalytic domain [Clostridia bacterium]